MTTVHARLTRMSIVTMLLLIISCSYASATEQQPLTPELAAKRENYRKQKAQQHITQDQRKAAAEALKAERIKVYQARQAVKHHKPAPTATDTK